MKWLSGVLGVGPSPWLLPTAERLNAVLRVKASAATMLRFRLAFPELSPTIQAVAANFNLRDLFKGSHPRFVMEVYDAFAMLRPAMRRLPLCPGSALLSKRYDLMNQLLDQKGAANAADVCLAAPQASPKLIDDACATAPLSVIQELAWRFWGVNAEGELDPAEEWRCVPYQESLNSAAFATARRGRLDVLQWLFFIWPRLRSRPSQEVQRREAFPFSLWLSRPAAENGHFEMLWWLLRERAHGVNSFTSFYACFGGVAKFLKENRAARDAEPAVLALIDWMRDQKIFTPEEESFVNVIDYNRRRHKLTVRFCETGSLPFLKSLFEAFETSRVPNVLRIFYFGGENNLSPIWAAVGRGGSAAAAQWLLATFGPHLAFADLFIGACASGVQEMIDWASERGTISLETTREAIDEAYLKDSPLKEELSRRYNYVPQFYQELEELNRRRGGSAEDLRRTLRQAGELAYYWYEYPRAAVPVPPLWPGAIMAHVWPPPAFLVGVLADADQHGRGHFFPVDEAYVAAELNYALGPGNTQFIEFFLENIMKPLGLSLTKGQALRAMNYLLTLTGTHAEIGHRPYFSAVLAVAKAGDLHRADLGDRNFLHWFTKTVYGAAGGYGSWRVTIEQLNEFVDRFALADDFYSRADSAQIGAYPNCSLPDGEDYGLWSYLTFGS